MAHDVSKNTHTGCPSLKEQASVVEKMTQQTYKIFYLKYKCLIQIRFQIPYDRLDLFKLRYTV